MTFHLTLSLACNIKYRDLGYSPLRKLVLTPAYAKIHILVPCTAQYIKLNISMVHTILNKHRNTSGVLCHYHFSSISCTNIIPNKLVPHWSHDHSKRYNKKVSNIKAVHSIWTEKTFIFLSLFFMNNIKPITLNVVAN
jgi:hypothetical protein